MGVFCGICGEQFTNEHALGVHANEARCLPRPPYAFTDLPKHYVGLPVGFRDLEAIGAGQTRVFHTFSMLYLRVSRLRWHGVSDGVYLVDLKVGHYSLHAGPGPANVSIAGHGVWRFPAETVQVSQFLTVTLENKSARTAWLGGLAFWGVVP